MIRHEPKEERRQKPLLPRLEQAAAKINPILMVLIAGLVILNLSVYMALQLPRLPLR